LLASYKELVNLVNFHHIPVKPPAVLVLKVREPGDAHFRLVSIGTMSIQTLYKALRKKFKRTRESPILMLVMLPDTLIEKTDELELVPSNAQLEVTFGADALRRRSKTEV
jgi:hypothetical protein